MTTASRKGSISDGPVRMGLGDGATAPPTSLPGRRQVADDGADGVNEATPHNIYTRQRLAVNPISVPTVSSHGHYIFSDYPAVLA